MKIKQLFGRGGPQVACMYKKKVYSNSLALTHVPETLYSAKWKMFIPTFRQHEDPPPPRIPDIYTTQKSHNSLHWIMCENPDYYWWGLLESHFIAVFKYCSLMRISDVIYEGRNTLYWVIRGANFVVATRHGIYV